MIETIKSISTVVITWLGIALTVWFAYNTFRSQLRTSIATDQLYKAYLPMFKYMEPYLYKDIQEIGIDHLENLINYLETHCNEQYELVEPQIISYIYRIKSNLQKDDFDRTLVNEQYKRLCSKIDFEFEKSRRRLGLPTRGPYYKLNHRQYENKAELAYYFFLITWKPILLLLISAYAAFSLLDFPTK